jgi:hypothetical protein
MDRQQGRHRYSRMIHAAPHLSSHSFHLPFSIGTSF